jgi:hypothetical protein
MLSLAAGCGARGQNAVDAGVGDAADAGPDGATGGDAFSLPLMCREHDGRCVVCVWEEAGEPRCRITDLSGGCPGNSWGPAVTSCPATPRASCDRSTDGYLEGKPGYPDFDYYYGAGDLTAVAAECQASQSSFSPPHPAVWTEYP